MENIDNLHNAENRQKEISSPKKAYAKPQLVEYGSIAKLTQGGGSQNGDAGNLRPCL